MIDIHNCSESLERVKKRLSKLESSDLLLGFIDHLEAQGLSAGRVAKYGNHFCTLFKNLKINPASANRADIERAVGWINRQPYKEWTKHDLKLTLRKIIQYGKFGSCDKKTPLPSEVSWISLNVGKDDSRVKPENLLTPEDVKVIVARAENERDRALLQVFFEGAFRPGELLTMKVGSVEFGENYCLASVDGKTGVKRVPLVVSCMPLSEWLQKHPERDNPEAPLWASLSNNAKGEAMSYYDFRKLLKELARKAGIKKDVWPYLFRHSCLTSLAKVFTESRLELYAGWVQGSKMARRYVHFSARDLEEAVLEIHGLKQPGGTDTLLRLVECPRCKRKNQPDSVRCSYCGLILDIETAIKMDEEERKKDFEIIERLQRLEKVISSLLKSQQESFDPEPNASTQQSPLEPPLGPSYQQPQIHPHPSP